MEPFFQSYYERMQNIHDGIKKALEGVPDQSLDWSPGPDMNSLSVLVTHLTGAERFLIGDIILGENSNRVREAEFEVKDLSGEQLRKRLDDTLAYLQTALERVRLEDLDRHFLNPRNGKQVTGAWAMLHPLEHAALHLGHIEITRQLWDANRK